MHGSAGGRPYDAPVEPDGAVKVVADGAKVLVAATVASSVAGGCAVAAVVFAVADPTPGRQARGLLITLAVVAVLGVGTAWVRVASAFAGRPPVHGGTPVDRKPVDRGSARRAPAGDAPVDDGGDPSAIE